MSGGGTCRKDILEYIKVSGGRDILKYVSVSGGGDILKGHSGVYQGQW